MMTDEQKSKVAELKSAIAAATTANGAPREVRVAAVSVKRELRRTGTTARELAAELGVHESTLCRWEREVGGDLVAGRGKAVGGTAKARGKAAKRRGRAGPKRKDRTPRFRMVAVTPAVMATPTTPLAMAAVTSATPVIRGLRVAHAPSGLVVDGLDVETLAALLRRMS